MKGAVELVQTHNDRNILELPRQLELDLTFTSKAVGGVELVEMRFIYSILLQFPRN